VQRGGLWPVRGGEELRRRGKLLVGDSLTRLRVVNVCELRQGKDIEKVTVFSIHKGFVG